MLRFILAVTLLCGLVQGRGQSFSALPVPFFHGDTLLVNALAGGLNNPQLSEADLNNDGVPELVAFDRRGNLVLPFTHQGGQGSMQYRYAPELARNFPPLSNWMMMRDFNGDGIGDIFAYSDVPGIDGIVVFRGYYTPENIIAFQKVMFPNPYRLIYFPLPSGSQTQLFVLRIDFPEVTDVDGDGDLDILTFGVAGGYLEYYANRSIEMGLGTDTLVYRLASACWGGFYESGFTEAVDLSSTPGQCYTPFRHDDIEIRHAGSTVLAFDEDNDGDKDLVLGDVSFENLNFLRNGGTTQTAWTISQDIEFPEYNVPVELPVFPAAFHLDLDRDGKKDLAVAPNLTTGSEDHEVIWFYRNTQTVGHHFELRQKDFLVETMLDFGTGANPAFADVNGDGLKDLVVGNSSYYRDFGAKDSRLHLYLNIGTGSEPAFSLADTNWLNLGAIAAATFNLAPAFGDLDGDGDTDLLVGEDFGSLFYFQNLAAPGQAMQFAPHVYPYMGIDVGTASTPCIADLNRDGLNDLLIGERNGNLNFFPNLGSPGAPLFQSDDQSPNVPFFGRIDARIPGFSEGHSAPVVVEVNGQLQVLTGAQTGRIEAYTVLENDFSGTFPLITETWGSISPGWRPRLALADLNGDQLLEAAVGNDRGGLQIFSTNLPAQSPSTAEVQYPTQRVLVYPNPGAGEIFFQLNSDFGLVDFQLFQADGKEVRRSKHLGTNWSVHLGGLPDGFYVWKITGPNTTLDGKLVILGAD